MAGETGPIVDTISLPIAMIIGGFFALACYNSIEIFVFIFYIFNRRTGLYFWSMLLANGGIAVHTIAALLRFFELAPKLPMSVLIDISWFCMVTGQAVVLYSRLYLVVGDPRKTRWVLAMIVTVFTFVQLPTAILFIAINTEGPFAKLSTPIFNGFEMAQISIITAQETIISFVYVREAARGLKLMDVIKAAKVKAVNRELVGLLILVVTLDITLMITQYTNHFQIQTTYKPVVYSIKLKVEALVLNNLISLVQSGTCTCWSSLGEEYSLSHTKPTRNIGGADQHGSSLVVPAPLLNAQRTHTASDSWYDHIYDGRHTDSKVQLRKG